MNKDNLFRIKNFYETNITNKLCEIIATDTKNILVTWSINETKIKINLSTTDVVSTYVLTYKGDNLYVEMENYHIITTDKEGKTVINGIQAKPCTIDLNTLITLQNIIYSILQMDFDDSEKDRDEAEIEPNKEEV